MNQPTGPGLAKNAAGEIEIVEGGRYALGEDSADVARLTDAQLKKMRSTFTDRKNEKRAAQQLLAPGDQYSTPAGSQIQDDLWYYQRLLSQIECEMQDRMLTLEGAADPVEEGTLTAKSRDAISDDDFALAGRRYPIHDAAHARNALARVAQNGTADEIKKVKAAVHKKYPNIGAD